MPTYAEIMSGRKAKSAVPGGGSMQGPAQDQISVSQGGTPPEYPPDAGPSHIVEPAFRNSQVLGMKSNMTDRLAALKAMHSPHSIIQPMAEGHDDAGSITVFDKGQITNYPPPSGIIPGTQDIGRMAGETVVQGGAALAGAGLGALLHVPPAAAAYVGQIGGAMAAPWLREKANQELPGGSTATDEDKLVESGIGGGISAAIPLGGAILKGPVRTGLNRAAAAVGPSLESLMPGILKRFAKRASNTAGTTSAEYVRGVAEKKATRAATGLGVNEAGNAGAREAVQAGESLGVGADELPASALGGERGLPPSMLEKLGAVADPNVEHVGRQKLVEGAEAYTKAGADKGAASRALLKETSKAGQKAGAENPEVADLVRRRKEAWKNKDPALYARLNQELEGMSSDPARPNVAGAKAAFEDFAANAPANDAANDAGRAAEQAAGDAAEAHNLRVKRPARQAGTNAGAMPSDTVSEAAGTELDLPSVRAPKEMNLPDDPAIGARIFEDLSKRITDRGEAATAKRVADKLSYDVRAGLKGKMSKEGYEAGIKSLGELAPHLQEHVRNVYADKLMGDKVLGKMTAKEVQHAQRVMGPDADALVTIDRVLKSSAKKLPGKAQAASGGKIGAAGAAGLGVLAYAHPYLAAGAVTLKGIGKGAKAARDFLSNDRQLRKVWANPQSRGELVKILAYGRKADPSDSAAAQRVFDKLAALATTEADRMKEGTDTNETPIGD